MAFPYKSFSEIPLFLVKYFSILWGMIQTNTVHGNNDGGMVHVYQKCKFHDPWGRGSCAKVWPYRLCSENTSLLPSTDQI